MTANKGKQTYNIIHERIIEMKKNPVLRTIAASVSAVCLLSAASCSFPGTGANGNKGEKPKQTASEVIKHSYNAELFGSTPDIEYINHLTRLGTTDNVLITGSDANNEAHMYITDLSFENFDEVVPELKRGENSELYCVANAAVDGTIFEIITVTDHGDTKIPDWDDPNFDYESFDWDTYNDGATVTTYIYTFDSTGKELKHAEVDMASFHEGSEDSLVTPYLGNVTPIDRDRALAYIGGENEKYYILNTDGTFGEQVEFPSDLWIGAICGTPEGNVAFSSWNGDNNCIGTIDSGSLKIDAEAIVLEDFDDDGISTLLSGEGDFVYYASNFNGLYGVKSNGSSEQLTLWEDSDLNGDNIGAIMSIGNNEFVAFINDYNDPTATGFYRITERDASELDNKTIIKIAVVYGDDSFKKQVSSFNKESDEYRIKLVDYDQYYEWSDDGETRTNTPAKQLKHDIIAGDSPDMIFFSEVAVIKGLTNKGVFVDLYDYLGKDGTVSKDDLMPTILKACEEDGKLYSISPSFGITSLAVKKKFFDKENWTIDELIETYNKLPEGTKLTEWSSTKSVVFNILTSNMSFVDYQNSTCSYDSDEFIKLLEFSNRFPAEEVQIDWENMTEEEYNAYYEEQQTLIRNDKALISTVSLSSLRDINYAKTITFGEDITLAGYPSDDGTGLAVNESASFAILSDSPNKDECWKFISRFFTEDYQTKNTYGIPSLRSAFEVKLDDAMEDPYWLDENGEKQYEDNTMEIGGEKIKVPNLSKEDREYVKDLVYNANVHGMMMYDSEVSNIVDEEIQAYFAGEKTAAETAKIIQNRVSIMISE